MSESAYLSTTGACDGDVHRFGSPGEILSRAKQEGEGVKVPPRPDTGQLNGRVMYIDSRSLTRECIGELLKSHLKGFEVRSIPSWSTGEFDALDRQPRAVIINSGSEPISSSAVAELINDITAHTRDTHIILLSNHDDFESISQAFALGVKGYIPTSLTSLVVVEVVRLVCLGGSFAPPSALLQRSRVQMVPPGCPEPRDRGIDGSTVRFTQRQVEILNCLRCGLSNKLVAHELSMSLNTVKVHVRTIMKKLNATNRTQVVCLTSGLFRPQPIETREVCKHGFSFSKRCQIGDSDQLSS